MVPMMENHSKYGIESDQSRRKVDVAPLAFTRADTGTVHRDNIALLFGNIPVQGLDHVFQDVKEQEAV